MVFQSLALFPHMTVFDNIGFPLRIKQLPAATIAERVRAVAATVKVDHLLTKKPSTLSGGRRNGWLWLEPSSCSRRSS